MSEPTITVGDKSLTIGELMHIVYDRLLGSALAKGDEVREIVTRTIEASTHNADLLEALEDGVAFRIAFKKGGAAKWTRIVVEDEDALQEAALREVGMRQEGLMENFARVFGIDDFSIDNI